MCADVEGRSKSIQVKSAVTKRRSLTGSEIQSRVVQKIGENNTIDKVMRCNEKLLSPFVVHGRCQGI
jgi:hypothetical protein